jgi:hypothetical protein
LRVLFLDECHLLWGNLSGYGWSRRQQRVDVAIESTKQRQTYYGALDYLTKQFVVQEYGAGNEDNTVAFLQYLQSLYPETTRWVIVWDGVSYHRSKVVQEFLRQTNGGLSAEAWKMLVFDWLPMRLSRIQSRIFGYKPSSLFASMPDFVKDLSQLSSYFDSSRIVKPLLLPKRLCMVTVHLLFRTAVHCCHIKNNLRAL